MPEALAAGLSEVGYKEVRVFGVEGPGWLLPDFEARWVILQLATEESLDLIPVLGLGSFGP